MKRCAKKSLTRNNEAEDCTNDKRPRNASVSAPGYEILEGLISVIREKESVMYFFTHEDTSHRNASPTTGLLKINDNIRDHVLVSKSLEENCNASVPFRSLNAGGNP